jgi:Lar family restriction alleviation protein
MEDLKLCPFCGGSAYLETDIRAQRPVSFVVCRSCACEGPWHKTESGAVHAWNMRTPEPPAKIEHVDTMNFS